MASSTAKNFSFNAGYQVLKVITPLVTTPYIARVLGAERAGEFTYTQAITSYFVMFAVLGMSTYGVRLIASATSREERSRRFWGAWYSQLIIGVVVLATYAGLIVFFPRYRILWLYWTLWVVSAVLDISWLFFGSEDFGMTSARSAIVTLIGLAAIFSFVKTRDDLVVYVLIVAGQALLSQILLWPNLRRHVDRVRVGWSDIKSHFVPNLKLFVPVIAVSLYNSMDTVIMGQLSSMKETGFYQYSYKSAIIPLAVITALGTVMLPRMSREVATGDGERGRELLDTSLWIMLAMAFAFMWGTIGVASEFVPVFLGDEFAPCVPTVALIALITPLCSVTNVLGVQYLLPQGRDTQFTQSVCAGAVANLIVSIALIPRLGAFGSAWGSVAAQAAVLVAQCIMVKEELPLIKMALSSLPMFVLGAIMAVFIRLLSPIVVSSFGLSPLALLTEVLIGVAFFAVGSVLWYLVTKDKHAEPFIRLMSRVAANRKAR